MASTAAIHLHISASCSLCHSKRSSLRFSRNQTKLASITTRGRRCQSLKVFQSVLNTCKSNDSGASEEAKVLLERLFAQTQRLEEHVSKDPHFPQDVWLGLSLENLESDLQAALAVLKKKEEDLQDAERTVLLERSQLNNAREELKKQEEEITAAYHKQQELEDELKQANLNLASQARQIDELKLQIREKDEGIAAAESALALKQDELNRMRADLVKKSKEAVKTDSELKSKSQLLNDANDVVKRQEVELQMLKKAVLEKEKELEISIKLHKLEEEKLEVAEKNLEKRTTEWLLEREELKKLRNEESAKAIERNETMNDFNRMKKLLTDVKRELVSSQKSLVSSRKKTEEQEGLLEKKMAELEEQKKIINAYMSSLKDAQIEVESERVKHRVAEAKNKELGRDLFREKKLTDELQQQLKRERSSLQQATEEKSRLQKELEHKNTEFEKTHNLLQKKASELVEAKLEIQHLKSEQVSLQLLLEEKDLEILDAQKKIEQLNQEIVELQTLMSSKEAQLSQTTAMLKEKDECVQIMQNELNDTKLKVSEAEAMVEQIVDLTNKLVISIKDKDDDVLQLNDDLSNNLHQQLFKKPKDNMRLQKKQLETELELTKESLRQKEMEIIAAERALTVKDEELKMVLKRLDTKEKEFEKIKEEMDGEAKDLKNLYALAQDGVGEEGNNGDLAIERLLQVEAAQLEVEAATNALQKLTDMSRELLNKASQSLEADTDSSSIKHNDDVAIDIDTRTNMLDYNQRLNEVKLEVTHLSSLTEQLLKEAGIFGNAD
ncbi:myosin-9-like [Cucurbita maxima]|uniref:Myosin-9-like n=1 Tax=Cucurbita maxima TaxID=3661 RepID=A0A6J1J1S0_CUCMA|nr:myosin-9-like [Cucurbita maxima]